VLAPAICRRPLEDAELANLLRSMDRGRAWNGMGPLMGDSKTSTPDRYDGQAASEIVREILGAGLSRSSSRLRSRHELR